MSKLIVSHNISQIYAIGCGIKRYIPQIWLFKQRDTDAYKNVGVSKKLKQFI